MVRTGRWVTALLAAVAALVLLGPGADGADGPHQGGRKPSFTLRAHEPYVIPKDRLTYDSSSNAMKDIPRLTPAFGNTGTAAAPRGVVLRVDLDDVRFPNTPGFLGHDNCYYQVGDSTVFCEFPDAVPVGAAYETAEPLSWVTTSGGRDTVEGAYRYSVWPLGEPPPGAEGYKKGTARGSGPALGLVPVAIDTLKGGGEMRFATTSSVRKDWRVKGITIRGRVGEYSSVAMEGVGSADRVRVELPPGTSFAPLSRKEREGTPSELSFCARDGLDGHLYCSMEPNYITLRVRIDRRVEGAEGRLSVGESALGDADPANNTAPIKLEITGTAPPGETDPPGEAAPLREAAPLHEAGPGSGSALAVAATAAALALVTVLLTRRGRTQRSGTGTRTDGPA
ncbi:hypothetical protein [Streptomyces sp. NPDC052496]|uniref:hypothetical protein n=1 Tax=Streptomyces sp. NPDC052496 TaxID=3154951 RepID=UPI00343EA5E7